jgi:hypothetical protein
MAALPASTDSGFLLITVRIFVLQNCIKFFKAVGLLYQSPPPSYFKTAILWLSHKWNPKMRSK